MLNILPLRLIPIKPNFEFMKMRSLCLAFSYILILASFISVINYKFNYGIDFVGGVVIELQTDIEPDLSAIRGKLNQLDLGEVVIQNFGSSRDIALRISNDSAESMQKSVSLVKEVLAKEFSYQIDYRKIDMVGPGIGKQMIQHGSIAVILAFVSIMLYVWVRFEWYFGIGVLLSLIHDVIISLGFMSITGLDFNLSSIAAILTVIGYSVNDSVVIYDRIRENIRKYNKETISYIIDLSINETLSRTTKTAITTLLANFALIAWGGEAIKSFSALVFFGVFIGTYSSIFISAPILTYFKKNHKKGIANENISK